MGENKDAVVGLIVVVVIIAIIVGAVFVLLPGEPETAENNIEKSDTSKKQDEALKKETEREAYSKLDPIIIQKIKNEFPILLEQQKKNLRDCQNIDSFQDYLNSISRLGSRTMEETIEEYEYNHSMVFWDLSNKGYDKHPEVKSLFQETETTSRDVLYCLDDIYLRYDPEFLK